jgi:hypothetical protein
MAKPIAYVVDHWQCISVISFFFYILKFCIFLFLEIYLFDAKLIHEHILREYSMQK